MADTSKVATRLVTDLMQELDLTREQALGLVGNLAHESSGFKDLTENGGKGYGYAQWTGPRRKEFESYAKAQGLKPSSYEANKAFIVKELKGKESGALRQIKKAETADQAASVAMKSYFRPGVPHLDRRQDWTSQFSSSIPNSALAAIDKAVPPTLPGRRPDSVSAFAPPGRTGNFSTNTAYTAGAGRGAKDNVSASPIRATATAQPSIGFRSSGAGSVNYTAPPPGLTSRSVQTIPIAPGNTRVPTTNLEQLQLATERYAQNYTPTTQRVADASRPAPIVARQPVTVTGSANGIPGAMRSASGSVSYNAPSPFPASAGVGGANQAGTNRMSASEPSIMQTIRPQLQAAQAALDAKPRPVTPSPQPTQAQMQAIRAYNPTPSVPTGVPAQTNITPKQINQNTPFNVPQVNGYQPVVKAYADRLTPAQQAIELVSPAKTPLQITVKGGKTTTGPFLPMSADAGARARANALIAANPRPVAQPAVNRSPAPLMRAPVAQQTARPTMPRPGGLFSSLFAPRPVLVATPSGSSVVSAPSVNYAYSQTPTGDGQGNNAFSSGDGYWGGARSLTS